MWLELQDRKGITNSFTRRGDKVCPAGDHYVRGSIKHINAIK